MLDDGARCALRNQLGIRMKGWVLAVVGILSSGATAVADSCITLKGSTISNKCKTCMEVTVRVLRPPAEQAAAMFASGPRSIRVEAGEQATVQGGESAAITDLKACP